MDNVRFVTMSKIKELFASYSHVQSWDSEEEAKKANPGIPLRSITRLKGGVARTKWYIKKVHKQSEKKKEKESDDKQEKKSPTKVSTEDVEKALASSMKKDEKTPRKRAEKKTELTVDTKHDKKSEDNESYSFTKEEILETKRLLRELKEEKKGGAEYRKQNVADD